MLQLEQSYPASSPFPFLQRGRWIVHANFKLWINDAVHRATQRGPTSPGEPGGGGWKKYENGDAIS